MHVIVCPRMVVKRWIRAHTAVTTAVGRNTNSWMMPPPSPPSLFQPLPPFKTDWLRAMINGRRDGVYTIYIRRSISHCIIITILLFNGLTLCSHWSNQFSLLMNENNSLRSLLILLLLLLELCCYYLYKAKGNGTICEHDVRAHKVRVQLVSGLILWLWL